MCELEEAKVITEECKVVFNEKNKSFYKYHDKKGIYKVISEIRLKRLIIKVFERWYKNDEWSLRDVKIIYDSLLYVAPINNSFDICDEIIVFKNGVLNIKNKQLGPFDEKYKATKRIPYRYLPYSKKISTPVFDQYLKDITLGDKEMERTLLEIIGYCMCNHIKAGKCIIFFGSGSNGKSVFCKFVSHILGECTALNMHDINKSRFSLHSMVGSKLNIVNELSNKTTLDDIFNANLKSIITGESVRVEPKGEKVYSHTFSTKILIATNILPTVEKIPDYSVKRRFLLIPFNATFSGNNVDTNILEKLKGETEGVISKAMEAYYSFQKRGYHFSYEDASDKLYNDEVGKVFPMVFFVKEKVRYKNGNRVRYSDLRKAYETWQQKEGISISALSDKRFSLLLSQALTFNQISGHKPYKSNGIRGVENITII